MNYGTLVFAIFVANLAAGTVIHLLFPARIEFVLRQQDTEEFFEEGE